MRKIISDIAKAVEDIRIKSPLAGSWTNFVTIEFVANTQLAVGARAAMCFLPDEAKPLASVSAAIYINLGTLEPVAAQALPEAAKAAVRSGKPWVLDPVAAGLGETRNAVIRELKNYPPSIIRGNASEIITLANLWGLEGFGKGKAEGVDACDTVQEAFGPAKALAGYTGGAVAVSGEVDLIVENNKAYNITGGCEMLKRITGAGCSLGGVMAGFAAVTDSLTAALAGSLAYKWASENAERSKGTASFRNSFIDNLSLLDSEVITKYAQKHFMEA